MPFGLRLLECLVAARCRVYLLYSSAAQVVAKQECDLTLPAQPREAARLFSERCGAREGQIAVFAREDWMAPVASGSNPADAMAVCPCSMGTLGAIAHGLADNLIERAADVMLKERRPLVLVPRETPLSAIHLDNMLKLAHAGAVILPPAPGFYTRPQTRRRPRRLRRRARARPAARAARSRAALGRGSRRRPVPRREPSDVAVRQRRPRRGTPYTLPLFPLTTVLFPGGLLPLKVFEQRYIDMTKACLQGRPPVRRVPHHAGRRGRDGARRAARDRERRHARAHHRLATCRRSASCTSRRVGETRFQVRKHAIAAERASSSAK